MQTGRARGVHGDSSAGYRDGDRHDWALHRSHYGVYHVWPPFFLFFRGRGRVSSVWEKEEEVNRAWRLIELLFVVFSFDNFFRSAMIQSVSTMISMLSLARYLSPLMIWCQPFVGEIKAMEVGTTYKCKTLPSTLFYSKHSLVWDQVYNPSHTYIGLYSKQDNVCTCKNISPTHVSAPKIQFLTLP